MTSRIVLSLATTLAIAIASPQSGEDDWQMLVNRASAAETAGDYRQAAESYREASFHMEKFAPGDARRAFTFNCLGMMDDALGQFADAETAYRKALAAAEQSPQTNGMDRAMILVNLAILFMENGQTARAKKQIDEALRVHSIGIKAGDLRLSILQNSLAELLIVSGRYQEAERLVNESIHTLESVPEARTEIGISRNNLGTVRMYQRRYGEAVTLLELALADLEAGRGPKHPILLRTLNNLAAAYQRAGQQNEAGRAWRRAIDLAASALGTNHPLYGEILGNYGQFLRERGDKTNGKAMQSQSTRILRDSNRRNGIGSVVDVSAFPKR